MINQFAVLPRKGCVETISKDMNKKDWTAWHRQGEDPLLSSAIVPSLSQDADGVSRSHRMPVFKASDHSIP